jgi:hypothetical protein
MDDGRADREAAGVERTRRIREPRGVPVAVLEVDVLDVELDAPVAVPPAQLDERRDRPRASGGVGEQPPQRRLIEPSLTTSGMTFTPRAFASSSTRLSSDP